MRRGEVYNARLDPVEGSEQAGTRPVVIVSRDAINQASNVVLAVPCTTRVADRRIYPSQVVIQAPEGGLTSASVALGEQARAIAKTRVTQRRGSLTGETMARLDKAIAIALDLTLR